MPEQVRADAGGVGAIERREWLRTLALSDPAELTERLAGVEIGDGEVKELRSPEVTLVLVTGRVGGTGDPFGLGEMTVTRCVVDVGGAVGVGYVQGRSLEHARNVALADALLQTDRREEIRRSVVDPIVAARRRRAQRHAADIASSRVEFVTMVRGE